MSEPIPSAVAETDHRPRDCMKRSQIEGLAALIVGGMGAACARTFAANDGNQHLPRAAARRLRTFDVVEVFRRMKENG